MPLETLSQDELATLYALRGLAYSSQMSKEELEESRVLCSAGYARELRADPHQIVFRVTKKGNVQLKWVMMKIYAVSISACTNALAWWSAAWAIQASNKDAALAKAIEHALVHWPKAEGWESHQGAVFEIPMWWHRR